MYLQPDEAKQLIEVLQCGYKHEFGGVMIYEATFSQNNQINGQPYAVSSPSEVIPSILVDYYALKLRVLVRALRSVQKDLASVCGTALWTTRNATFADSLSQTPHNEYLIRFFAWKHADFPFRMCSRVIWRIANVRPHQL